MEDTARIIIIDDVRTFRFGFHIRTLNDALSYINLVHTEREHLDELWLDHDLGGTDTIRPVVDRLEEWWYRGTPLDVKKIFIHSSNPVGRKYINQAINKLGVPLIGVDAMEFLV